LHHQQDNLSICFWRNQCLRKNTPCDSLHSLLEKQRSFGQIILNRKFVSIATPINWKSGHIGDTLWKTLENQISCVNNSMYLGRWTSFARRDPVASFPTSAPLALPVALPICGHGSLWTLICERLWGLRSSRHVFFGSVFFGPFGLAIFCSGVQ
jgi:hypothetical protein